MKRKISLLLVLVMAVTVFAGCKKNNANNNDTNNTTDSTTGNVSQQAPESALQILQNVWNAYGENEKFPIIGGNLENPVDNAPGDFNMDHVEGLTGNLVIPADQLAKVKSAALMIHMMNANTFTAGAVQLDNGENAADFAKTMQEALQNNRWICGTPEKLLIATFDGNYVLVAFGVSQTLDTFRSKLAEVYPGVSIAYAENIA